jgi:transposase InsO family protein
VPELPAPEGDEEEVEEMGVRGPSFMEQLRADAAADPVYQAKLRQATGTSSRKRARSTATDFHVTDGLLFHHAAPLAEPCLYVPVGSLRETLISEAHDAPVSGHLGRDKTLKRLQRLYFWPGMPDEVAAYCRSCLACQRSKPVSQKQAGLLHPHEVPPHPFHTVSSDIVTGLPETKDGNDCTVTFVCKLTKMGLIAAAKLKGLTSQAYADLLIKTVFRHYGMPKKIISDRDGRFTSNFWKFVCARLGTKLSLSTPFTPWHDGQTERAQRTIEEMLRSFVSTQQTDWEQWLPLMEFAYNSSVHAATGYTPFFLNLGREPHTPLSLLRDDVAPGHNKSPAAMHWVDAGQQALSRAQEALERANKRMEDQTNPHRRDVEYKAGDQVLLSTADLQLSEMPAAKLRPRYIGPFPVVEKVGRGSYRLQLPPLVRCHDVQHVSKLRPYVEEKERFPARAEAIKGPPPVQVTDGQAYFSLERIVQHYPRTAKSHDQATHYLVKWEGYPAWENTKEPAGNVMEDQPKAVKEYWEAWARGEQQRQAKAQAKAAKSAQEAQQRKEAAQRADARRSSRLQRDDMQLG